jgi:hypothetical protein
VKRSKNSTDVSHILKCPGAGASGSGILLLSPAEKFFLEKSEMRDLSIKQIQGVPNLEACRTRVTKAMLQVSDKEKAQAYQAGELKMNCVRAQEFEQTLTFFPWLFCSIGIPKGFP